MDRFSASSDWSPFCTSGLHGAVSALDIHQSNSGLLFIGLLDQRRSSHTEPRPFLLSLKARAVHARDGTWSQVCTGMN